MSMPNIFTGLPHGNKVISSFKACYVCFSKFAYTYSKVLK